jgi:hypothetical protein
MGLGKTLSTLAVIVASLARALEFAISGTREDPTAWTNLVPSKSTLVVVPSARESAHEFSLKNAKFGSIAGQLGRRN